MVARWITTFSPWTWYWVKHRSQPFGSELQGWDKLVVWCESLPVHLVYLCQLPMWNHHTHTHIYIYFYPYIYIYIYVCVCVYNWHIVHLEQPFPSSWWRGNQNICFGIPLRATTSTQVSRYMHRLPTKSGLDVIRVSCDDVPMMWGFQMMTFTSYLHQCWGKKG